MSLGRILGAVQLGVGALILATPALVARTVAGGGREVQLRVVRVLGGRLLIQGGVSMIRPSKDVLSLGVGVDVVHVASMVAVAHCAPEYRESAVAAAAMGGISAVLGLVAR